MPTFAPSSSLPHSNILSTQDRNSHHQFESQELHSQQLFGNVQFYRLPDNNLVFEKPDYPAEYQQSICSDPFDSIHSDLMQTDAWGTSQQFTPKLAHHSHQRESSLSSLGSTGPDSPYPTHMPNPQIAINDPTPDGLMDMHNQDLNGHAVSYYQVSKPMDYTQYQAFENSPLSEMAYPVTIPGPGTSFKHRDERNLLPAPDFSNGHNRSHPASVASSIAGDSPATPTVGEMDPNERRRSAHVSVPKLDRTMTDVYGDELFHPNFTITSSSPSSTISAIQNDVFSQRINAANTHHLTNTHQSPSSSVSRDLSPFRNGSSLAPSPTQDWPQYQGSGRIGQGGRVEDRAGTKRESEFLRQTQQQREREHAGTPQTISPKDAILEFKEPEDEPHFSLFPAASSEFQMNTLMSEQIARNPAVASSVFLPNGQESNIHTHNRSLSNMSSVQQRFHPGLSIPQEYPFISRAHRNSKLTIPQISSEMHPTELSHQGRPAAVGADSGTYTCTYHGCTLRFETPSLLQKHKREGHRQTHNMGANRNQHDGIIASSLTQSQAGPHRCDRVNPSTGKPCNTIFSRPYDLTRHEDTIHNARKQKVHCTICTEDKTFSRADALTRHYRVCHPDVEVPGKQKRRCGV